MYSTFILMGKKLVLQKGVIHILLLLAAIGVIGFLVVTSTVTFKDKLFNTLFPKPSSHAAGLNLTATFNSIGIELLGDDASTATLEFKKTSDSSWRAGLPLWQVGGGLYGSVLLLDPGTAYDIKVTPQGGSAITGTVTTRVDNIPTASSLTPTHFVRANGDDSKDGTSEATAWRTIQRALTVAPTGAVVEVGSGYYQGYDRARTTPITLKAQFPAVDDNQNIVNVGQHSIIEPAGVSSPTGSNGPNPGVWQQVSLTGPGLGGAPAGATYQVWKWTNSPVAGAAQLGYSTTRDGQPQRIVDWADKRDDLATPEGWAEKVYTNKSYNFGFASYGNDIYVRMVGDANPNNFYMTAGTGIALTLNAPNIRVSGLEIRQFNYGIYFQANAKFGVIDHNLLSGNFMSIRVDGARGNPSSYGSDHVVERNRFIDSNLWSDDQVSKPSIPWTFIKFNVTNANGSDYQVGHLGHQSETSAIGTVGGAQRMVVRNNTVDGVMNGFDIHYQGDYDRYQNMDNDFYSNTIKHAIDDAFDGGLGMNNRVWSNRTEHTLTFLASPTRYGPVFIFRNEVWRFGSIGVARMLSEPQPPAPGRVGGVGFKYSGASVPTARFWIINNTFWTDDPLPVNGGARFAQDDGKPENFYLRNNIFRVTGANFMVPTPLSLNLWHEDYNYFGTTDTTRGMRIDNTPYTTNVGDYRTATGQGAHTNLSGNFITPPTLTNPTGGNLSLPGNSPLIDAGVVVPNITDQCGVSFSGSAPDLGATETGSSLPCPDGTVATPPPSISPSATPTVVTPTAQLLLYRGTSSSFNVGSQFPVQLVAKTDTDAANLFTAKIKFDPTKLKIVSIDTNNSFVTNWVEEFYSNTTGTISLTGGVPTPGYKTTGQFALMATINFQALAPVTNTIISFDNNSAIFRDADNVNILATKTNASLSVVASSSTPVPTPSATPVASSVPTSQPTTSTTPPPVPDTVACSLTSASWSSNQSVPQGTLLTLTVTGTGDCSGKQVSFEVRENDSLLEGGVDEDARTQPANATFNGTTASTTWTSEYAVDGLFGMFDPSEYFFNATIVGDTQVLRSTNPLVSVTQLATSILYGDGNRDGIVDLVDLSLLFSNYCASTTNCKTSIPTYIDFNSDNLINVFDFSQMRNTLIQKGIIRQ
jgi:hypothetical protein